MSHFYATAQGNRGIATRCGTKSSGMVTQTAGWKGCVQTLVWHDEESDTDRYEVSVIPWQGSGGQSRSLLSGVLSSQVHIQQPVETALNGIKFALRALEEYNERSTS